MAGDGPNRMFIESLGKHGSQTLHTLRENFHTALKNLDEIEVFCFFETTLSPTAVQVRRIQCVWDLLCSLFTE